MNARALALLLAVEEVVDVLKTVVDSTTDFHGDQILITCPLPKRGGTDMEFVHRFLLSKKDIVILLGRFLGGVFSEEVFRAFAGESDDALARKGQGDVLVSSRDGGYKLFCKQLVVVA